MLLARPGSLHRFATQMVATHWIGQDPVDGRTREAAGQRAYAILGTRWTAPRVTQNPKVATKNGPPCVAKQ
jgi:hypothetical protein